MHILWAWSNRRRMSTAVQKNVLENKELCLKRKHDQLVTQQLAKAKEQKESDVVMSLVRVPMTDSA